MILKDASVKLEGVSWRMFWAAIQCEAVYKKYGAELVITSAKDGKHGPKSLHYEGLALDLRSRDLAGRQVFVVMDLKNALGPDYDVVLEADHIHVEYDPK